MPTACPSLGTLALLVGSAFAAGCGCGKSDTVGTTTTTTTAGTASTAPAFAVKTSELPDAGMNNAYPATRLETVGAGGPVTWSVASGALPPGVGLDASGLVAGTPAAKGLFSF